MEYIEKGEHQKCPSHANWLKGFFVVECPYNIEFTVNRVNEDEYFFDNHTQTPGVLFNLRPEAQSKDATKYILSLQIQTLFLTDTKNTWIEQFPSFYHSIPNADLIAGHFDIHNWQRPMDCAFTVTLGKKVVLKKGQPLYYVRLFNTEDRTGTFKLVKAELTDKVVELAKSCLQLKHFDPNTSFELMLKERDQPNIEERLNG